MMPQDMCWVGVVLAHVPCSLDQARCAQLHHSAHAVGTRQRQLTNCSATPVLNPMRALGLSSTTYMSVRLCRKLKKDCNRAGRLPLRCAIASSTSSNWPSGAPDMIANVS